MIELQAALQGSDDRHRTHADEQRGRDEALGKASERRGSRCGARQPILGPIAQAANPAIDSDEVAENAPCDHREHDDDDIAALRHPRDGDQEHDEPHALHEEIAEPCRHAALERKPYCSSGDGRNTVDQRSQNDHARPEPPFA